MSRPPVAGSSMIFCPVCTNPVFSQVDATPYWVCPACDAWFQDPMPPKTYEADHELDIDGRSTGHLMTEGDKAVNRALAEALFRDGMGGRPGRTLDIGSKYPYLSRCLKDLGCEAYGMDNLEVVPGYAEELGVPMLLGDFESLPAAGIAALAGGGAFRLVTLVHVFEHLYDPRAALRKLRALVADDGNLFLRLPDHGVAGFERDLTPGHFTIHPFFHALPSLLEAILREPGLFDLAWTSPLEGAGQRDLLLRPVPPGAPFHHGPLRRLQGEALLAAGHLERAGQLLERSLADGLEGDAQILAYQQWSRCLAAQGLRARAARVLGRATSAWPQVPDLWMDRAHVAYQEGQWREALACCERASAASAPWRDPRAHGDKPLRLASFCLEALGDREGALAAALKARVAIGLPDPEWEARLVDLSPKPPRRLALLRPGAIGDVIMTLNLVPALKARHPGMEVHYFCAEAIGRELWPLMSAAGVDAWDHAERLQERAGDFEGVFRLVGYPLHEGYPERPMARHLLDYFREELGLGEGDLPGLDLEAPPRPPVPGPYLTLHPVAGWSAYKNWPLERWPAVLEVCQGLPIYQIGAATDPRVPGTDGSFMGRPLMESVALLAHARLHLGVDSFTNHLTHIRWSGRRVPAVILWGSTQASAAGYPHNVNLSLGLPCQPCFREDPALSRMPRDPCVNPPGQVYEDPRHACMAGLTLQAVATEVARLLAVAS
ncbi:MAG TPA: methyltransferase domain-containing protein [Holophaga sp.]|nr:methyltransferase domain-containing protein [Holophaga sp.]